VKFAGLGFHVPGLDVAVSRGVESGLRAAAVLDGRGGVLATAGMEADEARAIAAAAVTRLEVPKRLERMSELGELLRASLDDREVAIGIAGGCVFVVVVYGADPLTSKVAGDEMWIDVERTVRDARESIAGFPGSPPASGGSSSGPAELPLIELGITVPRRRN
jgi:hypothetical protein